jgi:predicted 3-demethylubiquinone-9 3-methyltransferase (glyoxalase superfamily)
MAAIQKIFPCLWFDSQAEEAAKYYTSIFKNSRIKKVTHYGKEGYEVHRMPDGAVMSVAFELEGQPFMTLNGGPLFKFNEAVSLMIQCDNQNEIDYYWEKLSAGGDPKAQQCGWLKDKYGLSWQVTPKQLKDMMVDDDREKSDRVMAAMLKMHKLNIHELEEAYEGHTVSH